MSNKSSLEAEFDFLWKVFGDQRIPCSEYRFDKIRRFRFDRAWPSHRVAIELEGGVWSAGRHVRGTGFISDCIKYNLAQEQGWFVLRYTLSMLRGNPEEIAVQIKSVLDSRQSGG